MIFSFNNIEYEVLQVASNLSMIKDDILTRFQPCAGYEHRCNACVKPEGEDAKLLP